MMTVETKAAITQHLTDAAAHLTDQHDPRVLRGILDALGMLMRDQTTYEPAHGWRPGAVVWRCANPRCAKILGLVASGTLRIKHARRVIEVEGTHFSQTCDDCTTVNEWPPIAREVV